MNRADWEIAVIAVAKKHKLINDDTPFTERLADDLVKMARDVEKAGLSNDALIETLSLAKERPSPRVIRFAVYPGYMPSMNDMDDHFITAHQLMRLYEVDQHECIVLEPGAPHRGHTDEFIARLLPLTPRVKDYSPVTPQERLRYPLPEGQSTT